jgi:hypothetical protein
VYINSSVGSLAVAWYWLLTMQLKTAANCQLQPQTYWLDWRLNCCWPSPAQSFLVLSPMGLMTIFYWQLWEPSAQPDSLTWLPVRYIAADPHQHSHPCFQVLRDSGPYTAVSWLWESCNSLTGFSQSVKLLLAFASTVIPYFSLLEIHD